MPRRKSYGDLDLKTAIAAADSWRATIRALGLASSSSAAIKSVRARADRLGLDYTHFRGQRRWTIPALAEAVARSGTWDEVALRLSPDGNLDTRLLKGHVARLAIDASHVSDAAPEPMEDAPSMRYLDRAGPMLAAAWFTMCGHDVSWPLEPSRYDLLVASRAGIRRVQVKTTRTQVHEKWKVYLSTTRGSRRTYDPDEIDDFFIIDGDLNYYLIPVKDVGGLHALHLSAYDRYRQAPF